LLIKKRGGKVGHAQNILPVTSSHVTSGSTTSANIVLSVPIYYLLGNHILMKLWHGTIWFRKYLKFNFGKYWKTYYFLENPATIGYIFQKQ
jgi:hypothetical protein